MARKRLIGDKERGEVIAIVKAGGTLADAADIIGVARRTVGLAIKRDPDFCAGVMKARKVGKLRLVKRVRNARAWQAAAWILERTCGKEYGRKDVKEIRQKRTVKHEHRHTIDYDQLSEGLMRLAGGGVPANGRAKPVHPGPADRATGAVPRVAGA